MTGWQDDPVIADLTRARIRLLLEQPLFGHIILHLELQEASWCLTAATDGRHFFYNRDFIQSLTRDELVFLSGHEVAHAVLDHVFRCGTRDQALWGMAADFIVNDLLIKQGIGTMPGHGLYHPDYSSDRYTVDELYALLEQQASHIRPPLDMHLMGDGTDPAGAPAPSAATLQSIRTTLRAALMQGIQQQEAKEAGSTPAGLLRMIDRLLHPRINWRAMLDTTLRSAIKFDYSYLRPSRRSWHGGLVLPGQDILERVEAVACLDGSASTTTAMITDFLTECAAIMTTFRDFKLTIMSFDTEVYNVVEFTPDNAEDIPNYQFHGGGGTIPTCCWRYLRQHAMLPDKLLVFTDGEVGNDFGEPDYCDTLFIIHSNPRITAPYGQTVHYEPRS